MMPPKECPVSEVLFPLARARLLDALFRRPPRQLYVRELVGASGLSLHTVQDELRKLSAIGIVTSWSNGYHRFYGANPRHPLHKNLVGLFETAYRLPNAKRAAVRRASQKNKPKRRQFRPIRNVRQPHWGLFDSKYKFQERKT
jgi:hypothetical protein